MTINSDIATASYTGKGSTAIFSVPFYFLADADLKVSKLTADGASSVLVLNSDYTVSDAGNKAGGSITTIPVLPTGDKIFIERNVDAVQQTEYPVNGAFPAASHERALDRLTMLAQQIIAKLTFGLFRDPLAATYNAGGNTISNVANAVNPQDVPSLAQTQTLVTGAAGGILPADIALYSDLASTTAGKGAARIGWPAGHGISQAATTAHFSQNGASIHRLNDRLFVGPATANDAAYPNVAQDWLTQFQISAGLPGGTMSSATFGVLNSAADGSAVPVLGGVRTRDFSSAGAAGLGVCAFAINDHASLAPDAWAFYGEAHKTTAASGVVYGMELDTRTLVTSSTPTPYAQGTVVGLQLASGAGLSATGQHDASAALQIEANPMKFQSGIVFGATSLTGTDGVTGSGEALALAKGHGIQWYASSGAATARIVCQGTTGTNAAQLQLDNGTVNVMSRTNGGLQHAFNVLDTAVNYLAFYSSAAGNPVQINAGGADTNIDLLLAPKGAGVLKLGYNAITATTPSAFSATRILHIKDGSGANFYIPAQVSGW